MGRGSEDMVGLGLSTAQNNSTARSYRDYLTSISEWYDSHSLR